MLSGLRAGTPIYVFDKNKLCASIGEVISVSNPIPQYGFNYTQQGFQNSAVVDIKAMVDGAEVNYTKLPATATIADFGQGGIVISESREAILNEIDNFSKISEKALQDRPMHEERIAKCKEMRLALDRSAQIEAEQSKEIAELRNQVEQMNGMLAQLLGSKTKSKEE